MRSRRARRPRNPGVLVTRLDRAGIYRMIELRQGYEDARRQELTEIVVAADESLGNAVDGLLAAERLRSVGDAYRARMVNDLRRTAELNSEVTNSHGMRSWSQAETARRVTVMEVASALRLPDVSAQKLIEESRVLIEQLPATMAGLEAGSFSYRHVQIIIDHASSLPEELRSEFEQKVLPFASTLTPSKFGTRARTIRERMDASTMIERHRKAVEDRTVTWEPAADGMAWLSIYDTAAKTKAVYNRLTDFGASLQGPDEERTLTQLRTDAAMDLLLDGEIDLDGAAPSGIRPTILLTIPALSLLGKESVSGQIEPAILDGYGPIDIDTAKHLAGTAKSWRRVFTDPVSGNILAVDHSKRKIPEGLRAWLRTRDGTCRMPGCNVDASRTDLDHTTEWQDGGTHDPTNLACLCPKHHATKHHTAIRISQQGDGGIRWTMPSGHIYVTHPDILMEGYAA